MRVIGHQVSGDVIHAPWPLGSLSQNVESDGPYSAASGRVLATCSTGTTLSDAAAPS
jgi:hypothetical protein